MKNDVFSVQLTGGILKEYDDKLRRNFYEKIDVDTHVRTYEGTHPSGYAEPEFTGKFIDICTHYAHTETDPSRALALARPVIDSILLNQRPDGYLGCYVPSHELEGFSVWNQSFTMLGMVQYAAATGDTKVTEAALRCAHWIARQFIGRNGADILNACNRGSQHISVLYPAVLLYEQTGDAEVRALIEHLIQVCECSDMNLLTFEDILSLHSNKGIEMLAVYLGVLEYGRVFDCPQAIKAAKRYWHQLYTTQIRNTGNGTVWEFWTSGGNRPQFLSAEQKPNENCVAVGWAELSLALFWQQPEGKYLDALERTLFNHLLGSVSRDGEDFAYYQPNFGHKVFRTAGGMYQCCRYRGYTLFSCLKEFLYCRNGKRLYPVIYTPSTYTDADVTLTQQTDYPSGGHFHFTADARKMVVLCLHLPAGTAGWTVTVNGQAAHPLIRDRFMEIPLTGHMEVEMELNLPFRCAQVEIDGHHFWECTCGPLLLAADTVNGASLKEGANDNDSITEEKMPGTLRHFRYGAVELVDYASAGSFGDDEYTIWVPVTVPK